MKTMTFICLGIIIAIFTYLSFKNNIILAVKGDYKYISESDKDDVYNNFLFVKSKSTPAEFDKLIEKILYKGNASLQSKTMVINYIKLHNEKKFLNQLMDLKAYTNNITDSTYYGNPKTRNTSFFIALDNTIEEFVKE